MARTEQVSAPARFEPLYYGDLLEPVNPEGDVGLLTLWSPLRTVRRKLEGDAPELLDPGHSRIVALANLYGDGMFAMFCNLLFNPQVRHLVAIGQDLGLPTCDEIEAFLRDGLEETEMLGQALKRVRGTGRVFPAVREFDDARLRSTLSFRYLGRLSEPELGPRLASYVGGLPRENGTPPPARIRVDIPDPLEGEDTYLPSNVSGHQVIRRRPLDCWEELVVRCVRFGRRVTLAGGPRLHLLNAKAVIEEPVDDPEPALESFGFRLASFREYQERMLRPELPEGVSYTYGNRLRGYFPQGAGGTDALRSVVDAFRANPETRHAYVSLWDTSADLPDLEASAPCLTTLYFRRSEGRLALAATYRVHNLLTAWLQNVYGLMAVQRHVAQAVGLRAGPITVVSHFLGIDPRNERYALARAIAENWSSDDDVDRATGKASLREDPNGYFVVSIDEERGCIVAEHRYEGVLLKRYEAERAQTIERQVAADMAISLVSHAMWLGRELTRNEQLLRGRRHPPRTS
jgi:Thymidylate synthase